MKVIELGFNILGVYIKENYPSVNTNEDAIAALSFLQNDAKQKSILNHYLK